MEGETFKAIFGIVERIHKTKICIICYFVESVYRFPGWRALYHITNAEIKKKVTSKRTVEQIISGSENVWL